MASRAGRINWICTRAPLIPANGDATELPYFSPVHNNSSVAASRPRPAQSKCFEKLELVVEVDVNKANASIASIGTGLSSMEQAAGKAARGGRGDWRYGGAGPAGNGGYPNK